MCLFIPKNSTCRDSVCLSLPKDQQEENTDSRPSIVTSDININEEFNKFKGFLEEFRDLKTAFFTEINSYKKLLSHEMSQVASQNLEIALLSGDIFFLKEQIRNKDKVIYSYLLKRDDVLLQQIWPAIKTKAVSVRTVEVDSRAATTMATSSTSTETTAITTPSGNTNMNEKEKEKDTVNQNFTENIKGNGNAEKEVQNIQEKEESRKARTT